jgi:3-oxoadipate enol-lactonase
MPTVQANGVQLDYEEAGHGPTLCLIHAFPVGRGMWAPQIPAFADRFRVIAYDCRGFGRSEAPVEPTRYSPAASVEDARAVLAALSAGPAVACGLSMGGNIALNLALTHPESVRALVLCDTGAGSEDPAVFRARCEEYAQAAAGGMDAFVAASEQWSTFDDFARRGPSEAALFRRLTLAQPPHGIALTARFTLAPRAPVHALEARLRALDRPTLVICGEHDHACVETSRFLAGTIPGAELWMVPGASHFPNLDASSLFNERVLAFLREAGVDRA